MPAPIQIRHIHVSPQNFQLSFAERKSANSSTKNRVLLKIFNRPPFLNTFVINEVEKASKKSIQVKKRVYTTISQRQYRYICELFCFSDKFFRIQQTYLLKIFLFY